jgi:transcriptional regulator with XRE-family HTH domain
MVIFESNPTTLETNGFRLLTYNLITDRNAEGGIKVPVGEKLRELRKSKDLTQVQVADGINCTPAAYNRYETGERQPPVDTLAKLADYFGVSLDYLMGRAPISDSALNEYEKEFVKKLRSLPDAVKEDAMDFLDIKLKKKRKLQKQPSSK